MLRTASAALALALLSMLIPACGGGGGGDSGGGGHAVISVGAVTAIGSVWVNGIRYEDTAADITGDDSPKTLADVRKLGAVLRIRGWINDDGITGRAERIEIENEARGTISSIAAPDAFTVAGQNVAVDGATIFDDTTGLGGANPLAVGDAVEVHGARDAAGTIRATRVERLAPGVVDEVRGVIAARTGTVSGTITVGGTTYQYDAATQVVPAGAPFPAGTLVELHLNGTAVTRLEVESGDEPEFEGPEGWANEIEGFVTGFSGLPSVFFVAGQPVDGSGAVFSGGAAADLANGMKVEAEGRRVNGVLMAQRIEFRSSVRIRSTVTATGTGTFTVLGRTIVVNASTVNNVGAIAIGTNVEVRGFVNANGASVTAIRVDAAGSIGPDQHFVQGVVAAADTAARRLLILGIDVNAQGAEFEGLNDAVMGPEAFFAALVVGRTLVRARGTPGSGTLAADEVELE